MPPLTVAVDARVVFDQTRRGIAKTVIELYRTLAAARPAWRFHMLHQTGGEGNPFADRPNVVADRIDIPGDRFGLWEAVRLPLANLRRRPDLFHAPAGVAPRFPLAPLVTTINDVIPLDTRAGEPGVAAWGRAVRRAARRARVVLTASEHAKGRIVDLFAVPPDRVTVIRWGPASAPAEPPPAEELARVRAAYSGAGRPYVLHFGMADPRKNTAGVLAAWARLPAGLRAAFALVVVGVQGPALERFRGLAEPLGAKVHGYAPEADVRPLLAGAAVLCYPTLYEGFGLPALDGFAAGVPVLTANTTSLPEVVGDAAVTVDPADPAAIADGLARLLGSAELRAEFVARGRERAKRFTWDRCAADVAAAFEAAAGRG